MPEESIWGKNAVDATRKNSLPQYIDDTIGEVKGQYVKKSGDTMTGSLGVNGHIYIEGASRNVYFDSGHNSGVYWRESGYRGDAVWVGGSFSGSGDNNKLWITGSTTGNADPQWNDIMTLTAKSGNLWIKGTFMTDSRSVSYIEGARGKGAALYAKKEYNTNAWYPAVCLETKGGGSWQIGNHNNENLQFSYATKADRDSGTNTVSTFVINPSDGIHLPKTGEGYYLRDKNGNSYPGIYDNGTNLWIGAPQSAATHHVGGTYISTGYNGTSGNTTINVLVPNATNTGGNGYAVYHTGYKPSKSDVGLGKVTNQTETFDYNSTSKTLTITIT